MAEVEVTPQSELGTRILMLKLGGVISISKGEGEVVKVAVSHRPGAGLEDSMVLMLDADETMGLIEALAIAARKGTGIPFEDLVEVLADRAMLKVGQAVKVDSSQGDVTVGLPHPCRRCGECEDQEHHFIDGIGDCAECEDGVTAAGADCQDCPEAGCKHCPMVADMCEECQFLDASQGGLFDCKCKGTGVQNVRPGRVAA